MRRRSWLVLAGFLVLGAAACRSKSDEPRALYPIGDWSLTDQRGGRFGSAELRDAPYVAAFFFTRCPTVCPKIIARMKALGVETEKRGLPARLVAISVDPENDTPEILRAYAEKHGLDLGRFTLVTGDAEAVKQTALSGFKLAVEGRADAAAPDYGILHGSHLVLVDRAGQIRGYYRTSDDADMALLAEHWVKLARR